MKKTILLILALIVSNISLSHAQADLLEPFLAKDGLSKAQTEAATLGIVNPELMLVATLKKTVTVDNPLTGQPTDITINFNLADGKSNAWFYMFRSADNHENKTVLAVVKAPIIGFYAQEFTQFAIEFPLVAGDLNKSLNDVTWLNSDKMAELFRTTSGLTEFLNAHPNPETQFIGLSVNTIYEFIAKDLPIWSITVIDGSATKICGIDNTNQSVVCVDELSVDEFTNEMKNADIYPNPVENIFSVYLSDEFSVTEIQIEIFDSFGRKISSKKMLSENKADVNVSNLTPGVYYINIATGNNKTGRMFIKY